MSVSDIDLRRNIKCRRRAVIICHVSEHYESIPASDLQVLLLAPFVGDD